jgi:hypothetical protein
MLLHKSGQTLPSGSRFWLATWAAVGGAVRPRFPDNQPPTPGARLVLSAVGIELEFEPAALAIHIHIEVIKTRAASLDGFCHNLLCREK